MDILFLKVLNMSISASWLVLIVLALRFVLKKAPRWLHVCLWALVAVRLICPVSIESVLSLIPSTETVPEEIFYMEPRQHDQNATLEILEERPNVESVDVELDMTVGVAQTRHIQWVLLWPAGMIAMLAYGAISYLRLKGQVSASIHLDNGVCICDYIDTPFILGIVKPKICLPSAMEPASASHVLAHERAHIARKDHWWKPLGYGLLTIHWFNPLLWLAYILLCRDIELACDEKVIRDMELPQKKAYSEALLNCSVNRRIIAACPLAFGEVGVKERVKTVLNYKKPAFWIVLVAIIALIVTAVCFLTDPVQKQNDIFGATYQAETVIYRHPTLPYNYGTGETPLYHPTPEGGLRVMEDRCANIWHTVGNFSEVSLPKLNFADWFEYAGFAWEGEPSVEFIANTNRTAWILYADDPETGSRTDFYCLLQQENEDIYLLQGLYNAGQYRAQWLFLLEEFDYDSSTYFPLRWLHDLLPGDGIQTQLTTHFHEEEDEAITLCTTESNMLRRLLIHLKADQIAPGTLTGDTAMEASVKCQNESYPDVLLQYDGEAVQLTFTGNGAREGDWIIHSVALNEFFESYAQWNPAENPFIAPDSAAHFCQNITAEYVDYVFASETIAAGALFHQAQAVHLDRQQIGELLGILNDLPEAAFEAAEYPEDANQVLEIYCRNLWNDETLYPMGQLHILNGWVYFTFYFHVEAPYQTWKIDSSDLVAFIESLYEGERSGWETFAPYPASDGEVSCDFGGVEVIIPRLTCFHYEVGEESIRFKPEDQEGWVLIQYRTEPFGVCGTGLQTDEVSYKNGETFGVQGYYDGSDVWSFMSLTATSGDMVYNVVLLNEASAPWVTEYDSEISKLLNELNFLVMPSEG